MTDLPEKVSASQISQILQRAAEIDASGESLTVAELTRITDEAGIDRAATEAAIQEILATEDVDAPIVSVAQPVKDRIMLFMGVGGAVGVVLGVLLATPTFLGLPALGGMAVYSLFRAVAGMKRKTQLEFQLQNLVGWFAMFVSAAAGGAGPIDDLVGVMVAAWLAASFFGGLLIRYGPADPEPTDTKLLVTPTT